MSCTAIVEKGRNVISGSRDGTAKLWDCGQQTCLGTWTDLGGVVNDCAISTVKQTTLNLGQPEEPPSKSFADFVLQLINQALKQLRKHTRRLKFGQKYYTDFNQLLEIFFTFL